MIENMEMSIAKINELRALGIQISMDDFGVEYSSFSYLQKLPIDTLKLDRIFVKDLDHNQHDEVIIQSMISLGHQLGFKVLVEGVETQRQLDIITSAGSDEYQGYFSSMPIPIDDYINKFLL